MWNTIKQFFAWLAYKDAGSTFIYATQVVEPASQLQPEKEMITQAQPDRKKLPVGIEFYNRKSTRLMLWIELACIEVWLEANMEYRIESDETEYRLEFDGDEVTLYLQYKFGPRVLKRLCDSGPWEEVVDYSDIEPPFLWLSPQSHPH